MAVVMVFNLIVAFTVLTAILLVALLVCFVLFCIKRRRARPGTDRDLEETGDQAQADLLSRRVSRRLSQRQAQQVIYSEQQRMSTKTPPLQLLPEIETSDDRAIEWLEKGRCKEVRFDDRGLEHGPKTYHVLDAKKDGEFHWDCTVRQVDSMKSTQQKREPKAVV